METPHKTGSFEVSSGAGFQTKEYTLSSISSSSRFVAGTFRFDGRKIPFQTGDSVASALYRQGELALGRSMKYHRPRGASCFTGNCGNCAVRIGGEPNQPSCQTTPVEGLVCESQNKIGSAKFDLLGIVDKVFPNRFDPHHAFTKSKLLNRGFMAGVQFMSGIGTVPDPDIHPEGTLTHEKVGVLVIGGGEAGIRAANAAKKAGKKVLLVEEFSSVYPRRFWYPEKPQGAQLASGIRTLCNATAIAGYSDGVLIWTESGLIMAEATQVVCAVGNYESMPLFEGNDLPGILREEGARRLFYEHGILPGRRIAIYNESNRNVARLVHDLQESGAYVFGIETLAAAKGANRVEAVKTVDGPWQYCSALIVIGKHSPRFEIAQQLGADIRLENGEMTIIKQPKKLEVV